MTRLLVVGEDALSCVLGERIVQQALPTWSLARESIRTGGVTKLVAALPRYAQLARNLYPVLCVADTDRACPVELLKRWNMIESDGRLLVRLAVTESESWVLADRQALADQFSLPLSKIPPNPDQLPDPKGTMLQLASASRVKALRKEMVAADGSRPGAGYGVHLRHFVLNAWRPSEAASQSPSLERALRRLRELGKVA